ncbi:MAG TPA: tRNA pseudouridine(55) synthase TruB [Acidimicrobiales bacterium]|nr:tRNA pseudouridine(55) synthase TruB [Acidimicrobiales bacterium]
MSRRRAGGPDGICVIDKPAGWTSHDVVAKLRGVLGTRRVGHAGTLDPDATGVLVVGVGRVTRLLRFVTPLRKRYEGEIVLGVETSTLDAAGEVVATHDMAGVTLAAARAAATGLTGDILQVPPMVSALKVGGRRLHELAREGIEVEREARPVTVHRFDLAATDDPLVLRAEVECSSGTYVRSLAADLGHALGGGAHLRGLRRTAIGSFTLDEATPVEAPVVLPPAAALRDLAAVTVDDATAALVRTGRVLAAADLGVTGPSPWAVLAPDGTLLAVYEPTSGDRVKPAVVVSTTADDDG